MPPKKVAAAAAKSAVPQQAAGPASTTVSVISCAGQQPTAAENKDTSHHQPTERRIIISELLAYVVCYRDRNVNDRLRRSIVRNFVYTDVTSAKITLVHEFENSMNLSDIVIRRWTSTNHADVEADVDDIIGIITRASTAGLLDYIQFVAADLKRLPKSGPDEVDMSYTTDREAMVDEGVNKLSTELSELRQFLSSTVHQDTTAELRAIQDSLIQLQRQYDAFSRSMSLNVTDLLSTCANTNERVGKEETRTRGVDTDSSDRSLNVVVFGVDENKDMKIWREKLDSIFRFIVGREVEITDSFRLGRFAEGRIRPILVKLRTVWDRRLILYSCNKLRTYQERIYINPDESLDERRRKTFDRLRGRAERQGKTVIVRNGVLVIDDVSVYSLSEGSITLN